MQINIKNRTELAELFKENGFKVGAEVGVLYGNYSETLCQKIPGLKMYCIDPWSPDSPKYREAYEIAKKRLSPYDVTLIRKTSMDAVGDFANRSLDFVYIDGAHDFDNAMLDIIHWSLRVRKGGIVAGHDYSVRGNVGVIPAVNAYINGHVLSLYLTQDEDEDITWWFNRKWNL